ncbi:MAG TPA: amidohydrolase family protein [Acidimicrobiia bacterium]|nr:amidohydrolase family protein [Acidimicrobiia bacterium]
MIQLFWTAGNAAAAAGSEARIMTDPEFDLVVRGGTVVDGTGAPPYPADVAVHGGRIRAVGAVERRARRILDADGRVVCPGFVDVHTHLDAQGFWDPFLSPSPLHGVTTAIAGNCGFTIAPLSPASGAYLMPMLARVEGMPLESLRTGVPWDWSTTSEYLDRLDGTLAINTGYMVGHSAIRRLAMGDAANERAATAEELARMQGLLRDGLEAGALGFSTTTSTTHTDAQSRPVPSRHATATEMVELARVCRDFAGTSLELLPRGATDLGPFDDETAELMIRMSSAARRPLNWNVIQPTARTVDTWLAKLEVGDRARACGAKVVGLTMPVDMRARFSFHAGFVLDGFEGWATVLGLPVADRLAALRDPAVRHRLEAGAAATQSMRHLAAWDKLVLVETFAPANARFAGRLVGDIAAELSLTPFEALMRVVIDDELRTTFARAAPEPTPADWEARLSVWRDPRALIGASDAGAHLDMIAAFRYTTGFLQEAVRERALLPLEEAIHLLTQAPARLYGLRDRGVVGAGAHADLLVLDPDAVGSGPVGTRFDLPGGAGRLYSDATGIDHVFVGGVEIAGGGAFTGARPGRVLRAGVDTHTPTLDL